MNNDSGNLKSIFSIKKDSVFQIFSSLIPRGFAERSLLLFSWVLYFLLGSYIALFTSIIDTKETNDMYLSFDNSTTLYFGSVEKPTHPLTKLFYLPFSLLHDLFVKYGINEKYFTLIVLLFCSFFVAASVFFCFKYAYNIVKIDIRAAFLFSIFYSVFGGCIILSFTPETFTFSLFLLSLSVYIISFMFIHNQKPSIWYYIVFGTLIGGQTVTNAPKVVIPMLYEKTKLSRKFVKLTIVILFISVMILLRYKFDFIEFFQANLDRAAKYSGTDISLWDSFLSYFFGGNVIIPSLKTGIGYWGIKTPAILPELYRFVYQYIVVVSLLIICLISIVKNYKEQLLQIIILMFALDLFYLLIMRVGVVESFIYGGHFIFMIPMILAWLYKSLNINFRKYLLFIIAGFTLVVFGNNLVRVLDFIEIAKKIYP